MIVIVPVTAVPYAAARAVDEPNDTTSSRHETIRAALTSGM